MKRLQVFRGGQNCMHEKKILEREYKTIQESEGQNHSCFCKNCVPAPSCEIKTTTQRLNLLKSNYDRLVKQKNAIYQESQRYKNALEKISKSVRTFENSEVIKIADKALGIK